jgi:dihydroneopterin aldolase
VTGRIRIEDLRVRTTIGVHEPERRAKQEVLLTLELEADLAAAARSDALADAVDYEEVSNAVAALAAASSFRLVEALAGAAADLVLARFPRVAAVTVTAAKPVALAPARVSVTLRRARGR